MSRDCGTQIRSSFVWHLAGAWRAIRRAEESLKRTDPDRAPWLPAIHARMLDYFARGQDLIVGCSALKQSYRQVLAKGIPIIWDKLGHIDSAVHLPTRSDLCSSVDR